MAFARGLGALASLGALAACGRIGFDEPDRGPTLISTDLGLVSCGQAIVERPDGDGYLAAWMEAPLGTPQLEIRTALLDDDGRPRTPSQVVAVIDEVVDRMQLVPMPDGYRLFVQTTSFDVYDLDPAGALVAMQGGPGGDRRDFTVVPTPQGGVLVYTRSDLAFIAALDPAGVPGPQRRLDGAMTMQRSASATWVGDAVLVAYTADGRARFVRTDGTGAALGSPVAFGVPGGHQRPHVTGAGPVVMQWNTSDQLGQLTVIDTAGAEVWPMPVAFGGELRAERYDAAVASAGHALVTWTSDAEHLLTQIYAALIDPASPTEPVPLLLTDPAYGWRCPVIAAGAARYAVAFVGSVEGTRGVFVSIVEVP
jgi:hypothetical protein